MLGNFATQLAKVSLLLKLVTPSYPLRPMEWNISRTCNISNLVITRTKSRFLPSVKHYLFFQICRTSLLVESIFVSFRGSKNRFSFGIQLYRFVISTFTSDLCRRCPWLTAISLCYKHVYVRLVPSMAMADRLSQLRTSSPKKWKSEPVLSPFGGPDFIFWQSPVSVCVHRIRYFLSYTGDNRLNRRHDKVSKLRTNPCHKKYHLNLHS